MPVMPRLSTNVMTRTDDKWLYDKNWMSIIYTDEKDKDELYFIQTLDPLLVLKCDKHIVCEYTTNVDEVDYPFNWETALRGGSQFQHYAQQYYIGAVHSLFRMNYNNYVYREYGAHLVILKMPGFRFVYSTDLLKIDNNLYKQTKKHSTFFSDFFFPTSLLVESRDTILVGGHLNDDKSVLLRIYGIETMMRDVISRDKEVNPQEIIPKTNVIQKFYRSHFTQFYTNKKLKV